MTPRSIPRQSAAGFMLAAITIALGVYFGAKLAHENAGRFLLQVFYVLAAIAFLKSVFIWADVRGFPIRGEDGHVSASNLFRISVMAVIAAPVVLLVATPLALLASQLGR